MKKRNIIISALAVTTALLTIGSAVFNFSSNYSNALTSTPTSTNTTAVGQTSALFIVKISRTAIIRSGPGLSYSIVKTIPQDSQWYVLSNNNGWYKIAENQWIQRNFTIISSPIKQVRGATQVARIRSGPSLSYPIVGVLPQNTVKNVLEMSSGWCKIGNYEYINNSYIVDVGASSLRQGIVTTQLTSVRSGPGFNYNEVKRISKDTIVSIYGSSFGWVRIGNSQNNEWILSNSVKIIN